jgi:hypothetical protein
MKVLASELPTQAVCAHRLPRPSCLRSWKVRFAGWSWSTTATVISFLTIRSQKGNDTSRPQEALAGLAFATFIDLAEDWRSLPILEYTKRTMELLVRLLGGAERVKIMRFFLHHEDAIVSLQEVAEKTKSKSTIVRKELTALSAIGFIEKKRTRTVTTSGVGKKATSKVKEVVGFKLNTEFPHNQALKDLLFDFQLLDKRELANRFKIVGRIKLFLVAGIFIGYDKSRVDILLVGEAIKRPKAEKLFEALSAEIGREVIYAVMDVEEYEYRYKMYDRFIRDIVDLPHEAVIDKLSQKLVTA